MIGRYAWLLSRLQLLLARLQLVALSVGSLALLLWLLPPAREWLKNHGLLTIDVVVALMGLLIILGIKSFHDLSAQVSNIAATADERIIVGGVGAVYPHLARVCETQTRLATPWSSEFRSLDVLGLTLFTSWPQVRTFLEDPRFTRWHVRLFCLEPEFIRSMKGIIPDRWIDEAKNKIEDITAFTSERRKALEGRCVTLELYTYKHFPAMHGFRVQKNDVLCSFIHWEAGKSCVDEPYQFYEHFPSTDGSLRADKYRRLFESWLENAARYGSIVSKT